MSEYQYYQFKKLDSSLNSAQRKALRTISGRAEITGSSFQVSYNYGDLKAEPDALMWSYFDVGLYYADWGTLTIYIKLPHGTLPEEFLALDDDETIFVSKNDKYQLLTFSVEDHEHYLDDDAAANIFELLATLRSELIEGDYRIIYFAWLNQIDNEEYGGVTLPLINFDFNKLSFEQREFVELFYVSPVAIKALSLLLKDIPAHASNKSVQSSAEKVAQLTVADKDRLLCLLFETGSLCRSQAMECVNRNKKVQEANFQYCLTAAMLVPYRQIADQQVTQEQVQVETKRLKQERQAKEAHLNKVFSDRDALWNSTHQEAERSIASGYDKASVILLDLFEAYDFKLQQEDFAIKFRLFIKQHGNRKALLKRLRPIIDRVV